MLTLFSILILLSTPIDSNSQLQVKTPSGTFQGSELISFSGRPYAAFRGIPFALPPVGILRFAKPQPYPKFKGVFNATLAGPVCLQALGSDLGETGQEDCLYLNVFAPLEHQKAKKTGELKKVLVYIHGGAFFIGSGKDYIPGDLVTQGDVIVVTLNYRLSWLGFLKGNTPDLPGNQGYWDQLMALNWVKKNVKSFGGDGLDITIAGESMGGESVSVWSILEQGRHLFTKGLIMSGTIFTCPSMPGSSDILLDMLTDRVGCDLSKKHGDGTQRALTTEDMEQVIACLRKLPEESFILPAEGTITNKFTSIDGQLFPAPVPNLIRDKEYLKNVGFFAKKFLVTLTNNEGAPFFNGAFADERGQVSEIEYLSRKSRIPLPVVQKVYDWYIQLNASNPRITGDIWADSILSLPTFEFLDIHTSEPTDGPITDDIKGDSYFLLFNHYPSYMPKPFEGVFHEMDLAYLFDLTPTFILKSFYNMDSDQGFTEEDMRMKSEFIKIVTDFMKYGNPGMTLSKQMGNTWPPYDQEQKYLDFTSAQNVKQFPMKAKRQMWTEQFPKWMEEFEKLQKRDEL